MINLCYNPNITYFEGSDHMLLEFNIVFNNESYKRNDKWIFDSKVLSYEIKHVIKLELDMLLLNKNIELSWIDFKSRISSMLKTEDIIRKNMFNKKLKIERKKLDNIIKHPPSLNKDTSKWIKFKLDQELIVNKLEQELSETLRIKSKSKYIEKYEKVPTFSFALST